MTRYYVEDGSFVRGVKGTALRKCMMLGSCHSTPLENKASFKVGGVDHYIYKVDFFAPGNNTNEPNKTFVLNEDTKIGLDRWEKMCQPIDEYYFHRERRRPFEDISDLIKSLEEAASEHGKNIAFTRAQFETGYLTGTEARESYRSTGSVVKASREALKSYIENAFMPGARND